MTRRLRLAIATFERCPGITPGDQQFVDALPSDVEVEGRPWSDPDVEWTAFDAVVLRSTWDYHHRRGEFLHWLDGLESRGVAVWNDPALVRWNSDKLYLRELERDGHSVAPTHWVARGEQTNLARIAAVTGWRDVVVKPSVSASAHGTLRIRGQPSARDEARFAALALQHHVLVQPFLTEIVDRGEWSILFAGGRYSHAVLKRPAAGDFRVQKEFGGSTVATEPPVALVDSAARLVDDLPSIPLYARVDGVERDGSFLLVELELIEPDLFLEHAPGAPQALADALMERIAAATL